MRISPILNKILQTILPPTLYIKLFIWKKGFEEPELRLVYDLCDSNKISVDVGAANGLYLAHLYPISKFCYAFEPRQKALHTLKKIFSSLTNSIIFEPVALSNVEGFTELKILKSNSQLSTIEKGNLIERFGEVDLMKTPVKRLDSYQFSDSVGFIKIDVEGHEQAVLEGATGVLERDKPHLLIEIEERHKQGSVADIRKFLADYGYEGYYYDENRLKEMDNFDLDKLQVFGKKNAPYIFNFIYIHKNNLSAIAHLL
jgi:FkbM family methyltransferase